MKTFAVALVALLAISFSSAPVTAQTNYTNLLAAIQGQNLTGLAQLVRLAGLETALSNPNLTATLFAPNNAAVSAATSALASANVNVTQVLPIILQYHLTPNVSITFRDGQVLTTFLQNVTVANTTKTLSVVADSNGTWYLGGIIPGAGFNVSSRVRAGRSELYIIDGVLVPPSLLFNISLTVRDFVRVTPGYSILSALIGNDSLVSTYTSNPNLAVTVFAPNDTAFNNLFRINNITLSQLTNTSTARRILLNHVYPGYPAMAADVPVGNTTVPTLSANDTLLITRTAGANGTITVRGGGNSAPIPVIRADLPAAMSAIHAISGVILPRQNTTANATTAAGK